MGLLWHWKSKKQMDNSRHQVPQNYPSASNCNFLVIISVCLIYILQKNLPAYSHIDIICKYDFLTTIPVRSLKQISCKQALTALQFDTKITSLSWKLRQLLNLMQRHNLYPYLFSLQNLKLRISWWFLLHTYCITKMSPTYWN